MDRLPHCTPVWGGHSPACSRDGTFCSLASTHSGQCRPHGQPARRYASFGEALYEDLLKRRRDPFVLLLDRRHDDGQDGFIVDIINYEKLGLTDTSSRFFTDLSDADTFAMNLAAILILDLERVL